MTMWTIAALNMHVPVCAKNLSCTDGVTDGVAILSAHCTLLG